MRSISKFVPFNFSIWKFLTFNTGIPLFDMGTDFRTFFFYLSVASLVSPFVHAATGEARG